MRASSDSSLVTSHERLYNTRQVASGMLFALLFGQSKHNANLEGTGES
jgi:hypothetical protein